MNKVTRGAVQVWEWTVMLANTELSVFVDLVAGWWIERRGYYVVARDRHEAMTEQLAGLHAYVRKSGHLNTVSGRRPKVVERIRGACVRAFRLATPVKVRLHPAGD